MASLSPEMPAQMCKVSLSSLKKVRNDDDLSSADVSF
jgi:hypothetical protein